MQSERPAPANAFQEALADFQVTTTFEHAQSLKARNIEGFQPDWENVYNPLADMLRQLISDIEEWAICNDVGRKRIRLSLVHERLSKYAADYSANHFLPLNLDGTQVCELFTLGICVNADGNAATSEGILLEVYHIIDADISTPSFCLRDVTQRQDLLLTALTLEELSDNICNTLKKPAFRSILYTYKVLATVG